MVNTKVQLRHLIIWYWYLHSRRSRGRVAGSRGGPGPGRGAYLRSEPSEGLGRSDARTLGRFLVSPATRAVGWAVNRGAGRFDGFRRASADRAGEDDPGGSVGCIVSSSARRSDRTQTRGVRKTVNKIITASGIVAARRRARGWAGASRRGTGAGGAAEPNGIGAGAEKRTAALGPCDVGRNGRRPCGGRAGFRAIARRAIRASSRSALLGSRRSESGVLDGARVALCGERAGPHEVSDIGAVGVDRHSSCPGRIYFFAGGFHREGAFWRRRRCADAFHDAPPPPD